MYCVALSMIQNNQNLLEEIPFSELKQAYKQLEKSNKDMIDGLYYAAFVQQGLMPQPRHFRKLERPYFVIYNPLHIIGGDFFWIGKKEDWIIYAVGDCTGHGVSGAMLSALAIGFLNYVIYSKKFTCVGDILNEIDKKWIETFNHYEDTEVNNDWMEISIVAYNQKTKSFQFAGAGGAILLVTERLDAIKLRGNNYPIGGWQIELNRKFNTHRTELLGGEKVFLFSDGYRDQFGGPKEKRYDSKRFIELLRSSSIMPCHDQKRILDEKFALWKGNNEQTDDVCLLRIDL